MRLSAGCGKSCCCLSWAANSRDLAAKGAEPYAAFVVRFGNLAAREAFKDVRLKLGIDPGAPGQLLLREAGLLPLLPQ